MTGVDTRLNCCTKLGFFFGYGKPRVSNQFGRVEMDDYTFGLSSRMRVSGNLHALAVLGYGHQQYKTTRVDFLDRHDAAYSGDALYASLQLYQPLAWRKGWTVYPLLALDYQGTRTGKVVESGFYGQSIASGTMEELVLRFGVDGRFHASSRVNITTRLQYNALIAGDRYATARSRFTASSTSSTMNLRGIDLGRSGLTTGIGGHWYVDPRKRTRLFADYDFDFGERHTAHMGQFGFVRNW